MRGRCGRIGLVSVSPSSRCAVTLLTLLNKNPPCKNALVSTYERTTTLVFFASTLVSEADAGPPGSDEQAESDGYATADDAL